MRKGLRLFKSFLFSAMLALVLVSCDPILDPTSTDTSTDTTTDTSPTDTGGDEINEVSILAGWQDNLDTVYDPVVRDGALHMEFDKSGATWASAKKSLGAVSEDLADMTTLGIELAVEDYVGGGPKVFLLKIEFNDVAANPAREIKFKAKADKTTYEWDVSEYDLTDALQMLMFIDPGVGTTSGNAIFTTLSFAKTSVVEDPILVGVPIDVVHNVYDSGDPFDVNKNFYDSGDLICDIETKAGVTTINYDKYGQEYAGAYMIAEGVQDFDYINVKIKGPATKSVLLEVQGGASAAAKEMVVFTGEVQEVTINFAEKTDRTGEQKLFVFIEPGVTAFSSGKIEINLLEYSSTALVEVIEPDPIVHNIYEAGDPFDVNKNLYDSGDDVYDIVTDDGVTTLTYDKKVHSWASAYMIAEGVEGFDYFNIKIKGPVGKEAILKIEKDGAVEEPITFTGDIQDVTLNFGTKDVKTGEQTFRLFGEPGVEAVQGVIEISLLEYSSTALVQIVEPDPIVHNIYESGDPFDVNKNFYDGGDDVYDIETADGVTTVTYDKKGAEWASAYMIAEGVQDFDYVNVRIKGPDGKTAMLKNEGGGGNALEHVVSFDGTVQEVTIPFATKEIRTGEQKFLVFAEQGRGEGQGVIEISLLEYSSTALVQVVDPLNYYTGMNPWDKEWHLHKFVDGGDAVYDVDGKKVTWENQSVGGYQSVKALLDTDYRVAFTKFELIIEAAQAMKILVKVGAPLNIEKTLEFTAGNLTKGLVIDLSDKTDAQLKSINEILFFALFDNANPATGEFTITYAKFDSPRCAPVGDDAAPYIIGPSSYNINLTDNGTEIAWDSKGEWDAFGLPLEPGIDYSDVTKIEIKVSARTISELKVKINDDNAQQYDLEVSAYDDDVITLVATLHTPIDAIGTTFIIFFPDGGSSVAGHLTIVSINLIV